MALIRQMAKENRLWGAERIRGELLKLGLRVGKRTRQQGHEERSHPPATRSDVGDRSREPTPHRSGPATRFQVTDLFFRPLAGVLHRRTEVETGDPCRRDTLAAGCLGGTYRSGKPPRMGKGRAYLMRDHASKFGPCFARVAKTSTIKILKTPVHAPRANAIGERFAQERAASMPRSPADSA